MLTIKKKKKSVFSFFQVQYVPFLDQFYHTIEEQVTLSPSSSKDSAAHDWLLHQKANNTSVITKDKYLTKYLFCINKVKVFADHQNAFLNLGFRVRVLWTVKSAWQTSVMAKLQFRKNGHCSAEVPWDRVTMECIFLNSNPPLPISLLRKRSHTSYVLTTLIVIVPRATHTMSFCIFEISGVFMM